MAPNHTDLTWVEQTQTVYPDDPALRAIEANPGWRLIAAGDDAEGRTTLTFGWPWSGGLP